MTKPNHKDADTMPPNGLPPEALERLVRLEATSDSMKQTATDIKRDVESLKEQIDGLEKSVNKLSNEISHAKFGISIGVWLWRMVVIPFIGAIGYVLAKWDTWK